MEFERGQNRFAIKIEESSVSSGNKKALFQRLFLKNTVAYLKICAIGLAHESCTEKDRSSAGCKAIRRWQRQQLRILHIDRQRHMGNQQNV